MTKLVLALVVASTLVAAAPPDAGAVYPEKPITLIVPWPAGGVSDQLIRIVATPLGKELGQPIVVLNRPGATGLLGTHELENAPPDGYTIGNFAASQILTQYTSKNPNSLQRVAPIANLISGVGALTVRATAPWRSLQAYQEAARAQPGKIRVANSGTGGVSHIHGLMFDRAAQVTRTHIPFKGNAPALTAVAGGHVETTMISIVDVMPMVLGGQLRMLAIGGNQRHPQFPDVPTFREQGVEFDPRNWQGLVAPKRTPPEMIARLEAATQGALRDPATAKLLQDRGYIIDFMPAAELARFLDGQDRDVQSILKQVDLTKD
jgi:tripartite-type tricarboxylate transporter receptor subunit TctC